MITIYRVEGYPNDWYSKPFLYRSTLVRELYAQGYRSFELIEEEVKSLRYQGITIFYDLFSPERSSSPSYGYRGRVLEIEPSRVFLWEEDLLPVYRGICYGRKKFQFVYYHRYLQRWWSRSSSLPRTIFRRGLDDN